MLRKAVESTDILLCQIYSGHYRANFCGNHARFTEDIAKTFRLHFFIWTKHWNSHNVHDF